MFQNMKKLFSGSMGRKKLVIIITSFIVFLTILSFGTYEATKASVTVNVDGEEVNVRTHAKTVADILNELDITVRSEDYLFPESSELVTNSMEIVWEPAKQITLNVNNEEQIVWTTAKTVKELLAQQNITVSKHDKINPSLDTELEKDINIVYEQAFELTLTVGGEEQQVWSTSTTVADFLEQQEITLNDLDRVEPGLKAMVTSDSNVEVIRVEKVTDVVEEPIKFGVVTRNDNSLNKGTEKVVQQGQEGLVAKHYEVIIENGKEVSRELVETKTLKDSSDRIVAVGTKQAPQPQQVSRSNSSSSKEFYVSSTAYTANCNGCSGITSTGINLKANPNMKVIAVDPSVIPLGTKVHVEGYGYAVAGDTGGAIVGNKIDVFFPDKQSAYRWGSKRVKITILD
ncbi:G5 and 3D domain-containing protein [Sutcliffiella sp. NC1]|uniref:G5 and 3D domain-containing protein n=1 Tax=Sutcliffiella sp. NC1 TaxID=3004096 RepID=UPI0022DDD56B|nr:G5 and 3D domain-containing protein [Sutcliffiella sp. NC1]WBL15172.1 ubiquitin-like domain-containing protein [Sutcliffiella sp. NC1]